MIISQIKELLDDLDLDYNSFKTENKNIYCFNKNKVQYYPIYLVSKFIIDNYKKND